MRKHTSCKSEEYVCYGVLECSHGIGDGGWGWERKQQGMQLEQWLH